MEGQNRELALLFRKCNIFIYFDSYHGKFMSQIYEVLCQATLILLYFYCIEFCMVCFLLYFCQYIPKGGGGGTPDIDRRCKEYLGFSNS